MKKLLKTAALTGGILFAVKGLDNRIEVTHYDISSPKIPEGFDGYKILQISDYHADSVPGLIEEIEHESPDIIVSTGAKAVALIEEPMAAAMGAGLPVNDATGNMVVDIGGGTTEVAVISLGGIVSSRSIRIAGNALDSAIINYLKKENQINIGDKMAEDIKVAIASAYEDDEEGVYEVRGRDVATGLPKTAQIKESEIRAAISENVDEMIEAIKLTLENTVSTVT